MHTNIFDFQNSESTMQFNPLFLPANTFVENSGNAKSFKISSSSYLFSDIIKVIAGTTDLAKNLDYKQILPSDITSKQIPSENILSFNITENDLSLLVKESCEDPSLSSGLKELFELMNKLSNGGLINSLQNGNTFVLNNSANNKSLTSDELKIFLDKLNNLVNGAGEKSFSNGKNKNNKDSQELISKILDSLKNGIPVVINIVGKTETLKIKLIGSEAKIQEDKSGNVDYNNLNPGLSAEKEINFSSSNDGNIKETIKSVGSSEPGESINQIEFNNKQDLNPQENTKNSSANQLSKANTAAQTQQFSNGNANGAETDKIDDLLAELGKNKVEPLKDVEISPENTGEKTAAAANDKQKTTDSFKFLKVNQKTGEDIYKFKFEIVDNESVVQADKNSDVNKDYAFQANSTKSNSGVLTIEGLVASKSSLKDINKIVNRENNSTFNNTTLNINSAQDEVNKNPDTIKSEVKDASFKIQNQENEIKISSKNSDTFTFNPKNEINEIKTNNSKNLNTRVIEQYNKKADAAKIENSNPQQNLNLNEDSGKDIKVANDENQSANHREINSNSNLNNSIEADHTGKINLGNGYLGDNSGEDLSNSKQDGLNDSKKQDHIINTKGEDVFTSYLNKVDVNNIQNVRKPAYFNSFSDQMKTIDSSEIVKEISKLASDKDQKNIVLKLVPETLGKVKISLDISNNIIHAHAEVENEAAKSLMLNNIENLKQALVQQGLQLNSLNISLSNNHEQKSNRSYLSKRKSTYTEAQIGEIDEKEHLNVSKHFGYNTYEFLA